MVKNNSVTTIFKYITHVGIDESFTLYCTNRRKLSISTLLSIDKILFRLPFQKKEKLGNTNTSIKHRHSAKTLTLNLCWNLEEKCSGF